VPIAPRSYIQILEPMLREVMAAYGANHPHVLELERIITALGHLPRRDETSPEMVRERQREKEIIKRRIDLLLTECDVARRARDNSLRDLNGTKGKPESFDRMERLLADQAYRLCFWRVAADEINYRRFFDVNELAAIRVEDPQVFAAVYELILRLIEEGFVTGLRIDHVDGLFDPAPYLGDLQAACLEARTRAPSPPATTSDCLPSYRVADSGKPFYIVVEKILSHGELMRPDWPAHGTTGYGFLNQLNGVFVERSNEGGMRQLYERFTGGAPNFADLIYECKKLILRVAMSSESHTLARRLDRISEQGRFSRDFTLNSLQFWDFNLVDPDNRRPVDIAKGRELLASLPMGEDGDLTELVSRLIANPQDGRIKLYLISRALRFRRARQALFAEGDYLPLTARGQKESHLIAFARAAANQIAVVVAGRFFTRLTRLSQPPTGSGVWGESVVTLDHASAAGLYRDVFTGRLIRAGRGGAGVELPLYTAAHIHAMLYPANRYSGFVHRWHLERYAG
jgi:maltooligosyltrehalose synthase